MKLKVNIQSFKNLIILLVRFIQVENLDETIIHGINLLIFIFLDDHCYLIFGLNSITNNCVMRNKFSSGKFQIFKNPNGLYFYDNQINFKVE